MVKMFMFSICLSFLAGAQDNLDSECRVQAKEAAINTYQSCVKEVRSQKIDEIRKEYQEKLTELKSHYDKELKKIVPSKNSEEGSESAPMAIQLKKGTKKDKKLTKQTIKSLPAKKSKTETAALPVQNISAEEIVVQDKELSSSLNSNVNSSENSTETRDQKYFENE